MKYLAFDIEAANGYNPASICSVGVVVADEKFNVLLKENLWINPRSKYNLNGTRPNVGIDLHLDKDLLDRSPDFSQRYEKIRAMLSDSDTLVIGHAVDSDVRMLNAACKKYRLPSINFKFICSQLLYKCYKGDKNVMGLDKIAAELGLHFRQHRSDEDALMSLLTLKFLCESQNKSVGQLMEKYRVRYGENRDFVITRPASLDGQESKKKLLREAVDKIKAAAETLKKQKPSGKALTGKTVAICRKTEFEGTDAWMPLLKTIIAEGGEYTAKVGRCDIYVADGQGDADPRERYLKARLDRGDNVEVVTKEEFLKRFTEVDDE